MDEAHVERSIDSASAVVPRETAVVSQGIITNRVWPVRVRAASAGRPMLGVVPDCVALGSACRVDRNGGWVCIVFGGSAGCVGLRGARLQVTVCEEQDGVCHCPGTAGKPHW